MKDVFSAIEGAKFNEYNFLEHPLSDATLQKMSRTPQIGVPSLEIFSIGSRSANNPVSTQGHMWFSPVRATNGAEVLRARRIFSEGLRKLNINPWSSGLPVHFHSHTFVMLFGFGISPDPEIYKKTRESMHKMVELAAQNGFGEYRTHPAFMDDVMKAYSFNNNALLKPHETIKDALDPNGILSAGRYGIWPKYLRT
jgi:hypothetical protein